VSPLFPLLDIPGIFNRKRILADNAPPTPPWGNSP